MYKTLAKLAKGKTLIPVLGTVRVVKGVATTTDMEIWIEQPYHDKKTKGCFYAIGFDKGFAINSGIGIDDMPERKQLGAKLGSCALKGIQIDSLKWVMKAMTTNKKRYYLCGVAFYGDTIVSTDGHRLHSFKAHIEWNDAEKEHHVIVPDKALKVILELAAELKHDELWFNFGEDKMFSCQIGTSVVYGKLVDGTFPNYKQVIPETIPQFAEDGKENKNYSRFTPFDNTEFVKALPIVRQFKKIRDGSLRSSPALRVDNGFADTSKKINNYKFDIVSKFEIPIGFNCKYLSEICSGIAEYQAKDHPMIVRDKRGGVEKLAVIMPFRL